MALHCPSVDVHYRLLSIDLQKFWMETCGIRAFNYVSPGQLGYRACWIWRVLWADSTMKRWRVRSLTYTLGVYLQVPTQEGPEAGNAKHVLFALDWHEGVPECHVISVHTVHCVYPAWHLSCIHTHVTYNTYCTHVQWLCVLCIAYMLCIVWMLSIMCNMNYRDHVIEVLYDFCRF